MDDFGRIAWHWSSALAVLLFDHPEDFHQFCQSLLCCWHQGVAPGNGRNLSHPSIGLVSIEHDLVIIEAHVPSFYPGRAIVSAITRSIARLSGGFWRQFAQQLIEGNETRVEHALARADLHLRSRVVRSVPYSNSGRDSWKVAETSICVAEKIGIRQPDPLNVGAPRSVTALSVDAVSGSPSGMAALVISAAALGHGLVLVRGFVIVRAVWNVFRPLADQPAPHQRIPIFLATRRKISAARSSCWRVCVAVTMVRT